MSYCLNPVCQKCQNPQDGKFCHSCGKKLVLLGRYRAIAPLGQGGFGRTFRAIDEAKPSKPTCVIKQFFPIQQGTNTANKAAELFHQEAVRLEELGNHQQIPELLAHFEEENHQYLVQQFINGQNLAHILEQKGAFSETEIRSLLTDLLRVLEFVHSKQVIHRDIKPENIIRRQVDNQLVLVDFGAAKFATGTALARTGTVIGDFRYIAPEQAVGKGVFASDLYSLGVTCIHLLTNVEPLELFDTDEDAWVWQNYLPNPVSDELRSILDKMIQRGAKRRYQSVEEVLNALTPPKLSVAPIILNVSQTSPLKTFDFDVVKVNAQGRETNHRRKQAKYFSEDLGDGVTLEMVEIPSGTFIIGSPDTEKRHNKNENPQHQVTVAAFFMGKFAVTQAQWKAVANLPTINRDLQPNPSYFQGANRPVENVSWRRR
jgi:serine/threonine protein kinase